MAIGLDIRFFQLAEWLFVALQGSYTWLFNNFQGSSSSPWVFLLTLFLFALPPLGGLLEHFEIELVTVLFRAEQYHTTVMAKNFPLLLAWPMALIRVKAIKQPMSRIYILQRLPF